MPVKQHGRIFSAPMVRAMLKGRKTQTRRVIRLGNKPPRISAGDLMWVRETWAALDQKERPPWGIAYRATLSALQIHDDCSASPFVADGVDWDRVKWKSPLFLPRWASRIVRRYVSVRAERLQDITEADAKAEGISKIRKDGGTWKYGITDSDGWPGTDDTGWPWRDFQSTARAAYRVLWDQINGHRPGARWDDNPWVWREEFSADNVG